ncbi:hypothetical protein DPMN_173853 [Dreissena polymorpha]|uniref:Uncharacterized protein n=1 Tax=Dreissena polymorpha TaxID=45954 RepID=A0A9D4E490_DREPO|nr:hypothetical protein DPMN_173853 [Dreissena polymorpha]
MMQLGPRANNKVDQGFFFEDLVDYMIVKKAYDGKEMRAFRVLYGKYCVDSG